MSLSASHKLVERLAGSKIFLDYERAFSEATGLPLNLAPTEHWGLAHHGKKHENPFCAMMGSCNRTCAACLEAQQKSSEEKRDEDGSGRPHTVTCFAGLCETSVPLRLGDDSIGFLQTGQVMLHPPTQKQFNRVAKQLIEWGFTGDMKKVEDAYFKTRVLAKTQYDSMLRLLAIFSEHLATVSNQLTLQSAQAEPPSITRSRQLIAENQGEELSLGAVAKAIHMSTFYFCKTFKKATGLTFTQYVARTRVEKAKNLLLNPNKRVSEAAFAVGFQSITHFNRTFKKIVGRSPTEYREALPASLVNQTSQCDRPESWRGNVLLGWEKAASRIVVRDGINLPRRKGRVTPDVKLLSLGAGA